MEGSKYLSGETDIFIGRRGRVRRYLVCPLAGLFPVLIKTGSNSLAAIFRTGAVHVGITGTLAVSTSNDGGKSWSDPLEITPRWEDSRNPALGINSKREIVAAFVKAGLFSYEEDPKGYGLHYEGSRSERSIIEAKKGQRQVPSPFITKSKDNGRTWTEPKSYISELIAIPSPFGRIITAPDGTLLMPIYGSPKDGKDTYGEDISVLVRSKDGGETWGDETLVVEGYNETSFAILPNGTMVAAARSFKNLNTAILFSKDMGRTCSKPVPVTRYLEHPADLTVLQSGKLLLTFGRRHPPIGCGLLLSDDSGNTWNHDREVLLAGDGRVGVMGGRILDTHQRCNLIMVILLPSSIMRMARRWLLLVNIKKGGLIYPVRPFTIEKKILVRRGVSVLNSSPLTGEEM